ncbi:MAG: NHL repeat-containing protein, partial [archaeon]
MIKINKNFNLKNKVKAISPIISTILLILVAVILTMIFLEWSKNSTKNNLDKVGSLNSAASDIDCLKSQLIVDSCYIDLNNNSVNLLISNDSLLDFYGLKLTIEGKDYDNRNLKFIGSIIPTIRKGNITSISSQDSSNFTFTRSDGIISNLNPFKINNVTLTSTTCPKQRIDLSSCIGSCTDSSSSNLILFHNYFENLNSMDLSDYNNDGSESNIIFNNGANFNALNSRISVTNNSSLSFDENNFAFEFLIDDNYTGTLISKSSNSDGELDIYIDEDKKLNVNLLGEDYLDLPVAITNDENYIYIADNSRELIIKKRITDFKTIITKEISVNGIDYYNNNLYVISGNDILVLDALNLGQLSSGPSGVSLASPNAISVTSAYTYVLEKESCKLIKLNTFDLSYVSEIGGTCGSNNDLFSNPLGLDADSNYVFIADTNNNRIMKRNVSDLSYVSKIGSNGSGNTEFNLPNAIEIKENYIYVADTYNNRIVKLNYSDDLNYVSKFGTIGSGNTQFNLPTNLTITEDYIFVS